MKQVIAIFTHEAAKLFYVGVYNHGPKQDQSSSMKMNYHRASFLHNQMKDGLSPRGLKSGFMMAIINTDFTGWEREILPEIYSDAKEAALAKLDIIELWENTKPEYKFVGSHMVHVKGVNKNVDVDQSWTKKWSVGSLTKEKIRQKIEFIVQSISDHVPETIYRDAYMCVAVEGEMQRKHNWGSYEIVDLISLFRYVRNYIGKDL